MRPDEEALVICTGCHRTEFGLAEFRARRCRCGGTVNTARHRDLLHLGAMATIAGPISEEELGRLRGVVMAQQPTLEDH